MSALRARIKTHALRALEAAIPPVYGAALRVVNFLYVEIAATEADRVTFREMQRLLGRRLSVTERQMVITMRLAADIGAADRAVRRAAAGLGPDPNPKKRAGVP